MSRTLVLIALALASLNPLPGQAGTLLSDVVGLGPGGVPVANLYFDVRAETTDLQLCALGLYVGADLPRAREKTVDITVWYRFGTAVGNEGSPVGWTLLRQETGVAILEGGPNQVRTVEFPSPITVFASETVGFAIEVRGAAGTRGNLLVSPTGTVVPGQVFHVGPHLSVMTGRVSFTAEGPFNTQFTGVAFPFQGIIHYGVPSCPGFFILPTRTVGPTLGDDPTESGAFRAGEVTIIQGDGLGQATIPPGSTLTVEPGAIVKPMPGVRVQVQGALDAEGSVWTSHRDDARGGDSNQDGAATTPQPGDWAGVTFSSSSTGSIDRSSFRYAGGASAFGPTAPVLDLNATSVSVTRSSFTDNDCLGTSVVDLSGNATPAALEFNFVADNAGHGIGKIPFGSLGAVRRNAALRNAGGNELEALGHQGFSCGGPPRSVQGLVEIDPASLPEGVIIVRGRVCVDAGGVLILHPDTKIKFDPAFRSGIEVRPAGTLEVRGGPGRPVCITSLPDDSVGGDTNGDGPSSGSPGDIEGVTYVGNVGGQDADGRIDDLVVRYTGATGGFTSGPGVEVNSPTVEIDGLRVERGVDGVRLRRVERAINIASLLNGGYGLSAGDAGADHDVVHVTARGNGGPGITADPGWTGDLVNANAYDNLGGNIDVLCIDPSRVHSSNGMDPALGDPNAGNVLVDPQWASSDGPELLSTSALIDAGQAAISSIEQIIRPYGINGASGTTGPAPDIGATERAGTHLGVTGALVAGGSITVDVQSEHPTAPLFIALSFNPFTTVVSGLGTVAGGLDPSDYLLLGPYSGQASVTFPIPDDPCASLDGIAVSFQALGINPQAFPELSNPWIGTITDQPAGCP